MEGVLTSSNDCISLVLIFGGGGRPWSWEQATALSVVVE